MRYVAALLLLLASSLKAQELFIQTEPASNMPVGRFGLRIASDSWNTSRGVATRIGAEVMYGISKELMVHGQIYGSHAISAVELETYGAYLKYRFYADDDFKYHFRMAAFGQLLLGSQHSSMPEFTFKGSGPTAATGVIATLLENHTALSTTIGFDHALSDIERSDMSYKNISGVSASLSAGYLLFPSHYTNYSDINVNIYAEVLSSHSWYDHLMNGSMTAEKGTAVLFAPGVQLIVNSVLRIDLSYSTLLSTTYSERRPNSLLGRLEYNFY